MLKLFAFVVAASLALPTLAGNVPPALLFQNRCAECHGKDARTPTAKGRAAGAPNLAGGERSAIEVEQVILHGKGRMAPIGMKLSPEQVGAVAAWVARLQ
ncbi:c-type cytochrome [Anaeromyxobacter paludicola]|uniref:Cytochrome c domain-containing protein n=1 Tax=Anaeromyxobacter paludicola TaxID=2918171 RepID=A0ABN6N5S2_9BACT|nr:cytochrome c [Anaeromyxobacter paludicola]BDG07915.1 hypothetical protein AMPC_10280 [Anaeromyxobacter paludicola]